MPLFYILRQNRDELQDRAAGEITARIDFLPILGGENLKPYTINAESPEAAHQHAKQIFPHTFGPTLAIQEVQAYDHSRKVRAERLAAKRVF